MVQGEKTQTPKQAGDDLESYRRLIEIQKQLVKMQKQHEKTKRECDDLREQAARELFESLRLKGTFRHRIRRKIFKVLKRLPRLTAPELRRLLNSKKALSC